MNITCVICSDLVSPNADIYSTPCGHIFHYSCLMHWLEKSKTCPQCRNKVLPKNLIRLYVNIATSQGVEADIPLLQHKLDSVEFSMKLKNQELNSLAIKNKEIHEQNKSLRAHTKKLELGEKRFQSVIAAQKDQIKYFKEQAQNCDRLKEENARLKNEVKTLDQIQIALGGTRQQVEEIIQNENSIESLALLASMLKKSLVDSGTKNRVLQIGLKKAKNELAQVKRKESDLRIEHENFKLQFEAQKRNYDQEVSFLKEKFSQLASKASKETVNDSFNNSIRRVITESPVNFHRTPVLNKGSEDVIDLDDYNTPPCLAPSQSILMTIKDMTHENITDDSPLSASSMGIFGIQRAKMLGAFTGSKLSIFKAKQSAYSDSVSSSRPKSDNVTYDGLGGSSKEDIFPSRVGIKRSRPTKTTSSKFKKLSADAGRNTKDSSGDVNLS